MKTNIISISKAINAISKFAADDQENNNNDDISDQPDLLGDFEEKPTEIGEEDKNPPTGTFDRTKVLRKFEQMKHFITSNESVLKETKIFDKAKAIEDAINNDVSLLDQIVFSRKLDESTQTKSYYNRHFPNWSLEELSYLSRLLQNLPKDFMHQDKSTTLPDMARFLLNELDAGRISSSTFSLQLQSELDKFKNK